VRLMRVLVHISRLHRAPGPGRRRVQGRENKTDPGADQGRPADQIAWRGPAQEAATVRKGIPADIEVSVDDHRAATSTARPAASTGASPSKKATQNAAVRASRSSSAPAASARRPWTVQPPESSIVTGTDARPSSGTPSSADDASVAKRMSGRIVASSYAACGPPRFLIQPASPSSTASSAPSRLAPSTADLNPAFRESSKSRCAWMYTSAAPDQPPCFVGD